MLCSVLVFTSIIVGLCCALCWLLVIAGVIVVVWRGALAFAGAIVGRPDLMVSIQSGRWYSTVDGNPPVDDGQVGFAFNC